MGTDGVEVLNQYLVDAVYILIGILALLLATVIIVRLVALIKSSLFEKRKKISSEFIFGYLAEEIMLEEVGEFLKENLSLRSTFVELLRELSDNLDGDERERIEYIFHLPYIYEYYLKKLDSEKLRDVAEAMKFFQTLNSLTSEAKEKIYSLIKEKNYRIAYGAASSLGSTDDIVLKVKALKLICQRKDISKVSILELLFILAPEVDDLVTGAVFIEELIKDEEIHIDKRAVLIRGIGELNQVEYAPFLFGYLTEILEDESENIQLKGVLVEALGKFYFTEIRHVLKKLIKHKDKSLKIYSAKALGALGDKESIFMLKELLNDPAREVRVEAMKQVVSIGPKALEHLKNGRNNITQIQIQTMQELKEIKNNQHV